MATGTGAAFTGKSAANAGSAPIKAPTAEDTNTRAMNVITETPNQADMYQWYSGLAVSDVSETQRTPVKAGSLREAAPGGG